MSDEKNAHGAARNLAIDILRNEKNLTIEKIREVAGKAVAAAKMFAPDADLDVEALTAELRHLFSVAVEAATVIEEHDPTGHVPWLPGKRPEWQFWQRYVTYLERDFGMPPAVVNSLDRITDMILERLEAPDRNGPWDRRGMVVGSVQSGKTANYIGLTGKAVDAGYKLVIVLAGLNNNLRSQTQLRIDEGVLGFDTQKSRSLDGSNQWIGVGRIPGKVLHIHSLTTSAEEGDFNRKVAQNTGVMIGSDPVVLVVKKNSKLLGNLLNWVLHVAGSNEAGSDRRIVKDVPLLLIDDEADNASINTKDRGAGDQDADSVTAINGKIREILGAFEKSAYVGYTATPFANIFINPDAQTERHGDDIFPRSFIINVKSPSNYIGPEKVFGLDGDPDAGIEARDGLPVIVPIDDHADEFPPRHKKDHVPAALPASLRKAIRCFILVCAARRARGQATEHNSMLVHVTRFIAVQEIAARLVSEELLGLRRRIEFGDGSRKPALVDELRELWEECFVEISRSTGDEAGTPVTWDQVRLELHAAAGKIDVLTINGFSREALDYREHKAHGRSVIAIGGDKLSRGLTLEGLSISYFLRTSRMYDTLMQMGRWFGYRPGYADLCRLFTPQHLVGWYRHIALVDVELRREFDYMVQANLTPKDYGLRVRTHPDGLIVTALNKMCNSQTVELSWSGLLVQTAHIPTVEADLQKNLEAVERLIGLLGRPARGDGRASKVWTDVDAGSVEQLLASLRFPPQSARASGQQLAGFIAKQRTKESAELTSWTVVLVSIASAPRERHRDLGGVPIGLIERSPESLGNGSYALRNANILNPADEGADFEEEIFKREWFDEIAGKRELTSDAGWLESMIGQKADDMALELTRRWQRTDPPKIRAPKDGKTSRPNGRVLRVLRRPRNGLLLIYPLQRPDEVDGQKTGLKKTAPPAIGVALSFPTSATTQGYRYAVNRIWDKSLIDDDAYEED